MTGPNHGSAEILLVEDEVLIQDILLVQLEEAGFDILMANDASQAIAELNAGAERFKAVVTDITTSTARVKSLNAA